MALVKFLLDSSVLTRLDTPSVRQRIDGLVLAGSVALCSVVAAEVLRGTRSPDHHRLTVARLRAFRQLPTPDEVWDRLFDVQAELVDREQHQHVDIQTLLAAAVAERHRVTVLHYDQDFDTIAEITGQRCEWVVPRGSV